MRLGLAAVASVAIVVLFMQSDWMKDASVSPIDAAEVEANDGEVLVTPDPFPVDPGLEPPARQDERAAVAGVEPTSILDERGTEPDGLVRITAVCVDESGDPLAGVALSALSLARSPVAYADSAGRVELELERTLARVGRPMPVMKVPGAPVVYELSVTSRARRNVYGPPLEELADHDLGRVVLPPGGTVVGCVVGSDGLPLASLSVCSAPPIPALNEVQLRPVRMLGLYALTLRAGGPCAMTDLDGMFVLEGVSTKAACVWTRGEETYAAWTDAFQVEPGATLDVGTLTLDPIAPEDRVEGVVIDAGGLPVPGAEVESVLVADGAAMPVGMALAGADGCFVIPALRGEAHQLQAHHPVAHRVKARLEGVRGGDRGVELRFEATEGEATQGIRVTGRVVRRGEPEAGAVVTRWLRRGASRPALQEPSERSDAQGKFTFEVHNGDYWFRARSADGAWVGTSELTSVARDGVAGEVVIELEAAASIEGRVLVAPGLDASGIEFRARGPYELTEKTSSRSDGTFELERLQSGSWTVERRGNVAFMTGDPASAGADTRELVLAPGEVASLLVDLRGSAQLDGRLSIGDQHYSAWECWLVGTQGGFGIVQGQVGFDGTFHLPAIPKLGGAKLTFAGRMGGWRVGITAKVSLVAGANTWSLEVPAGSVELRGLPLDAAPPLGGDSTPVCALRFEHSDGTVWEATPLAAIDGRLLIECVPAGHVVLHRGMATHWSADASDIIQEFEVRVGETTRVTWAE